MRDHQEADCGIKSANPHLGGRCLGDLFIYSARVVFVTWFPVLEQDGREILPQSAPYKRRKEKAAFLSL